MELPDGPPRELTPVEKARHGFSLTGDEARAVWGELDRLKAERHLFRARLVDVMPWVGCCPYPNTPGFTEMFLVKELAQDALDEVAK